MAGLGELAHVRRVHVEALVGSGLGSYLTSAARDCSRNVPCKWEAWAEALTRRSLVRACRKLAGFSPPSDETTCKLSA